MSDRPTPETDACSSCDMLQHARKLERQRDEAREWQNVKVSKNGETHTLGTLIGLLEQERDEAREELQQARQAIQTFLSHWDWMDGPEGWTEACARLHEVTKAKEALP